MAANGARAARARVWGVIASSILSMTVLAHAASAQDSDNQDAKKDKAQEIVVTGSRVARSGFDAPQPLTVINDKQIKDLGLVNVGEVARTIPQNTPYFTETNVGIGNFNVGAQLANLRGLNPFFGTRTLTLVDTKRVVPNSEGGAVDLTLIPSMLVARVETVTGGASAAYGSDAIAGVVNIILDTKLQGFKAQIDGGETFRGDGADYHAAFATGTGFAGGKGHALLGGEFQHQDAIGQCSHVRDWCASSYIVGTNSGYAAGNGYPNYVVAPNGKFMGGDNGVVTPFGPGSQMQFTADGQNLVPYDPGQFGFSGFLNQVGGDGNVTAYDISNIRPEIERYALLGHVSWDFTDSFSGYVEAAYSHSQSSNYPANGSLGPNFYVVQPDNAFLSPAVQAAEPGGFLFQRSLMPSIVSGLNTTENKIERFVVGLNGDLFAGWKWDGYYEFGRNENHQKLYHNTVGTLFGNGPPPAYNFLGWSLDAVYQTPGDVNSPIVCRATDPAYGPVDPLAAGCVPLNLFGTGNASKAAIDYAFRTLVENSVYKQNAIGVNARGDLFEGWAGPFKAATGFEWRKDEADTTHDRANQPWADSYILSWGGDRSGDIQVFEGYGELNAPLLKDLPLAKSVEVDLAARRTRNEASSPAIGNATRAHDFWTWKTSAIWDVVDWVRLRGTLSRDVRAAGFYELFFPTLASTATPGGFPAAVNNPWNSGIPDPSYTNLSGGNPDLAPERADTTTVGIVLSPHGALEGFRFSADWYQIKIKDAITPPLINAALAQAIVDACFNSGGASAICGKIGGAGTNDITQIDERALNLGSFTSRGVDFEANYGFDLDKVGNIPGHINTRLIATYLYDMIIDPGLGAPAFNAHGQTGPVASFGSFNTSPDWQANMWLTYSLNRFSSTLEMRYIGPGTLDAQWFTSPIGAASNTTTNSVNNNHVDSRFYFTLSGSYDIPIGDDRSLGVFAVVNNIFDTAPAIAPGGNGFPTNPVFFDTLGARFRVGVRMSY